MTTRGYTETVTCKCEVRSPKTNPTVIQGLTKGDVNLINAAIGIDVLSLCCDDSRSCAILIGQRI